MKELWDKSLKASEAHDWNEAVKYTIEAIAITSKPIFLAALYFDRGCSKYQLGDKKGAYADWQMSLRFEMSDEQKRVTKKFMKECEMEIGQESSEDVHSDKSRKRHKASSTIGSIASQKKQRKQKL